MVIGLAGGVGSGKSTVLDYLEDKYNFTCVRADLIAKEVMSPGTAQNRKLKRILPKECFNSKDEINSAVLSGLLFADKNIRDKVNETVHKEVTDRIKKLIKNNKGTLVIESAIIYSSGLDRLCDEIWFVYSPKYMRRERLKRDRSYSNKKIDMIFKSQAFDDACKSKADFVIRNKGDISLAYKIIDEKIIK